MNYLPFYKEHIHPEVCPFCLAGITFMFFTTLWRVNSCVAFSGWDRLPFSISIPFPSHLTHRSRWVPASLDWISFLSLLIQHECFEVRDYFLFILTWFPESERHMINVAYEKQVLFLDTVHLVNVMGKKPAFVHLFENILLLFENILFLTSLPKILGSIFEDYCPKNRVQMVLIIV